MDRSKVRIAQANHKNNPSHAFRWQNGVLTDLGALATGWSSATSWISDTGLIVGLSQNDVIDPLSGAQSAAAHAHPMTDGEPLAVGAGQRFEYVETLRAVVGPWRLERQTI
jgi:uncharacterized membrane protein